MFGLEVAWVHRGGSKCRLRRHRQVGAGAQAGEGGWKGQHLGGHWASGSRGGELREALGSSDLAKAQLQYKAGWSLAPSPQ